MRTTALVGLVLLVALAGCLGASGGGQPADAPTDTPTTTSAPPDDTTTEPPGDATTTPPDGTTTGEEPTAGDTVAYGDLSSRQQAAFEAAIDGEVRFVPDTPYVNDSEGYDIAIVDSFKQHDYVRYEGERYRLSFRSGRLYAQYGIQATAGDPGEGDAVTALADLPEDVRDEVRTAIEEGDYHAPAGKWDSLPEPLAETGYVRSDGETYRMSYVVGDTWAPVMTTKKVE